MKGKYKINNISVNIRNIKRCLVAFLALIVLYWLWTFPFQSKKKYLQYRIENGKADTIRSESRWRLNDRPKGINNIPDEKLIRNANVVKTESKSMFTDHPEMMNNLPDENLKRKADLIKSELDWRIKGHGKGLNALKDEKVTRRPDAFRSQSEWRFKDHPQGLTEQSFNQLIEDIETKDECPHSPSTQEKKERVYNLPKLGKVYESEGSLKFKDGQFILDGKLFRILSGAMHYFRVLPEQWEDRMLKMKAMGLNTLETYVAWNLHEDKPGQFIFEGMLDVRKFIELADKVGLYVIFRPGPYICAEWDLGGLPAWLLKDPNMTVRSNYPGYLKAVDRFFDKLIPMVTKYQHLNGGPIIAVQIENEFGAYSSDVEHLLYLKKLLLRNGIKELLFYSEGGFGRANFYDEALPTANFKDFYIGEAMFKAIRSVSKDFPLFCTEFWPGWFDHWDKPHASSDALKMADDFCHIMKVGASVNFYMFHGGTNFGFMAGANAKSYKPDVTSYDYIAPVSEDGSITPKFVIAKTIIQKYASEFTDSDFLQVMPQNSLKAVYGDPVQDNRTEGRVNIESYLPLEDMLAFVQPISLKKPIAMEMLDIDGSGFGQNYGFILYRTRLKTGKALKLSTPARDRAQIFLNGIEIASSDWNIEIWTVHLPQHNIEDSTLDILVENHGRINQGYRLVNEERKGISGDVLLDGTVLNNWHIYPLEFKEDYITKVCESNKWKIYTNTGATMGLFKGKFLISGTPADSFINMKGWTKGIVIVNGFNLGRYWNVGPQRTLYVPAPVLKRGENKVLVFEQYKGDQSIHFQTKHVLE